METQRRRLLLLAERTTWAFGLVGLVSWGAFHVAVAIWTRHDLERFASIQVGMRHAGTPDQSLWSAERVSAWRKALSEPTPAPLAVLRIPTIQLEVPVLRGTDDHTLDRAVGHVEDTAPPGTDGNSVIAGHRDGFFRGLKDVTPGDVIELDTLQHKDVYRVERTWVVNPEDVSVLDQTPTRTLTLVTCYPFYFIGSAPPAVHRPCRTGRRQPRSSCVLANGQVEHSEMESLMTRAMNRAVVAAAVVCLMAVVSLAQQQSTTEIKTFEVLAVDGNQLIVRLPEGTRELTVPDDFRFNIDGRQLSVHELKVGTKGTATITTRTTVTPVTVTEVKNGTVVQATSGTIIVRTDEGVRSFSQGDVDRRGVKIMKDGKPAQVLDFHKGDRLSATIITSKPPKVMTEKEVQATVATATAAADSAPPRSAARVPSAPSAPAAASAGSGSAAPATPSTPPAPASTAATTRTLPKTGSVRPLLGLASVLSLALGLALTIRRRFVS